MNGPEHPQSQALKVRQHLPALFLSLLNAGVHAVVPVDHQTQREGPTASVRMETESRYSGRFLSVPLP